MSSNFLKILVIVAIISIVIINIVTYKDVTNMFFTTCDTLLIIKPAIIAEFDDLIRVLKTNIKWDFYRPISTLTFGLDFYFWDLNPFGYRLTDLILHILVSLTVFWFAVVLLRGRIIIGWICGLIFSIHPISKYVISQIADRYDIIFTLFLLLSLIFFSLYVQGERKKKLLYFSSILLFAIATFSKESAIIFPFIVISYGMIFFKEESLKLRILDTIKLTIPYSIVVIIFLIRYVPLTGFGRTIFVPWNFKGIIHRFETIGFFFNRLLLPTESSYEILTICFFIFVFSLVFIYSISRFLKKTRKEGSKIKNLFGWFSIIVFIISFLSIIFYGIILQQIYQFIEMEYERDKPIVFDMECRDVISVEEYKSAFKRYYLDFFLFVNVASLLFFIYIVNRKYLRNKLKTSQKAKVILFLATFLIIFAMLYGVSGMKIERLLYIPAISSVILLCVIFSICGEHLLKILKGRDKICLKSYSMGSLVLLTIVILTILFLISISIIYSPLFTGFEDVENNSKVLKKILLQCGEITSKYSEIRKIEVLNVPIYHKLSEHSVLWSGVIENWLEIKSPTKDFDVYAISASSKPAKPFPDDIKLSYVLISPTEIKIDIKMTYD